MNLNFLKEPKYITEITGLRGIAVILVLLYHLQLPFFNGGFIGVDVFFVISGFVISKLLIEEINNRNCINFKNFYIKRIRRILPALIFTTLISYVIALLIFDAQQLKSFSVESIFSLFGISNFYFFNEINYFNKDAFNKILLHTWSLGIEGQFYLIWPLLLLFITSFNSKIRILFILIVISFFMNVIVVNNFFDLISHEYLPENREKILFYLLPFRAFEFFLGALLVWLIKFQINNKNTLNIFFLLGISLLGLSVILLNDGILFPYFNAFLPIISTFLLIYSYKSSYAQIILSNKLMIFLGVISYSLYLVHWPIILLIKTLYGFSLLNKITIIILSFILSIFSYKFIETPFRKTKLINNRQFFQIIFIILLGITVSSIILWNINNKYINDTKVLTMKDYVEYNTKSHINYHSNEIGDKIVVIGDSYAKDLLNIFKAGNINEKYSITFLNAQNYCQFMYGVPFDNYKQNIRKKNQQFCYNKIHKRLENSKEILSAKYIFIVSSWADWGVNYLSQSLKNLRNSTKANIILFGKKVIDKNPMKNYVNKVNNINYLADNKGYFFDSQIQEHILKAKQDNIQFISFYNIFCKNKECTPYDKNGFPIFFDKGHLTPQGAKFFYHKLKDVFIKIFSQNNE